VSSGSFYALALREVEGQRQQSFQEKQNARFEKGTQSEIGAYFDVVASDDDDDDDDDDEALLGVENIIYFLCLTEN